MFQVQIVTMLKKTESHDFYDLGSAYNFRQEIEAKKDPHHISVDVYELKRVK